MRRCYQLIGILTVLGLMFFACDSVTDSELSDLDSNNQTLVLESAEGQGNSNAGLRSGPGKVTVGTDVSSWEVGSGQFNGEFVVAERNGIEVGLRAQQRFEGILDVTGNRNNKVGIYEAEAGDTGGNNATWNYDWHVDLANAHGVAAGTTLEDYQLALEQNFTEESLFGTLGSDPVILPMVAGICNSDTFDAESLCQQSWNPGFGNIDFDPDVEATYNLRLVLTPETFNGPPLSVAIEVNVTDAVE